MCLFFTQLHNYLPNLSKIIYFVLQEAIRAKLKEMNANSSEFKT